MFPYLSIYLQDILGYSPLATGVRFLPLTAFVFFVPLATRHVAARVPLRIMISAGLALVAAGLARCTGSMPTRAGLHSSPASSPEASVSESQILRSRLVLSAWWIRPERGWLRASANVPPRRRGSRGRGAGALLQNRVENSLSTTAGDNAHSLGAAVSSAGTRAVTGQPDLVEPAKTAFVSGLNAVLLAGSLVLVVGAVAAALLLRSPAAPAPVTKSA